MLHEYGCRLDTLRHCFAVVNSNANNGGGSGGNSSNGTDSSSTEMNVLLPVFELNIALQDLQKFVAPLFFYCFIILSSFS